MADDNQQDNFEAQDPNDTFYVRDVNDMVDEMEHDVANDPNVDTAVKNINANSNTSQLSTQYTNDNDSDARPDFEHQQSHLVGSTLILNSNDLNTLRAKAHDNIINNNNNNMNNSNANNTTNINTNPNNNNNKNNNLHSSSINHEQALSTEVSTIPNNLNNNNNNNSNNNNSDSSDNSDNTDNTDIVASLDNDPSRHVNFNETDATRTGAVTMSLGDQSSQIHKVHVPGGIGHPLHHQYQGQQHGNGQMHFQFTQPLIKPNQMNMYTGVRSVSDGARNGYYSRGARMSGFGAGAAGAPRMSNIGGNYNNNNGNDGGNLVFTSHVQQTIHALAIKQRKTQQLRSCLQSEVRSPGDIKQYLKHVDVPNFTLIIMYVCAEFKY